MEKDRREAVEFVSTDGVTRVHGWIWWPEQEPRAVVQLVHGMAEHILRYEPFAHYLNEQGFVVCGHDHVGHGKSVPSPTKWGCLPARDGRDVLVGDMGRMRGLVRKRVDAHLPHFVFGHSMGSFVTRAYIAECGQGLAGAVICGTGHIPPATSAAGNLIARAIARTRGEDHVAKILTDLTIGGYAKAIGEEGRPLAWLSYNEDNIAAYEADESCGFAFSAGGNATLMALTREVCSPACCARVPHDLPLLFIAGDGDPVGDMGQGVRTAARMAQEAGGTDVTVTIYPHMRHEILNEDDGLAVMADVVAWMEARMAGEHGMACTEGDAR